MLTLAELKEVIEEDERGSEILFPGFFSGYESEFHSDSERFFANKLLTFIYYHSGAAMSLEVFRWLLSIRKIFTGKDYEDYIINDNENCIPLIIKLIEELFFQQRYKKLKIE